MTKLVDLTSADLSVDSGRLLLVPLGSCEQHGGHLPLDTDTRVAAAVATAVASRRDDLVVAPALSFGASGEHQGFRGTISMGTGALRLVLVELARSLGPEFGGLVLLSWHGGNAEAIAQAVTQLRNEGHEVLGITPTASRGDAHAGWTETAIMLALDPAAVHLDRAEAGNTQPIAELMPAMREGGLKAVTESGVLGDPAEASADEGRELLAELVTSAHDQLRQWSRSAA